MIAGHDRPDFLDQTHDPRIAFHRVDWEPPHPRGPAIDKSWKVAFAAMMVTSPSHYWMVLDADDLLHRDTVEVIGEHRGAAALIFDRGWEFDMRLQRALPRNRLAALCGSTAALSTRHFPLPGGREWDEWEKVPYIHHGHNQIKALLAKRGLDVAIPDKRYVAYLAGHDSSWYQRHRLAPWKRLIGFRLLGKRLEAELTKPFSYNFEI